MMGGGEQCRVEEEEGEVALGWVRVSFWSSRGEARRVESAFSESSEILLFHDHHNPSSQHALKHYTRTLSNTLNTRNEPRCSLSIPTPITAHHEQQQQQHHVRV